VNGAVLVVDEKGLRIPTSERITVASEILKSRTALHGKD
jgi:hypothetical protein